MQCEKGSGLYRKLLPEISWTLSHGNDVGKPKLAGISNKQLFSFHSTIYYTVKFKCLWVRTHRLIKVVIKETDK